ncbi:hypothetical protein BRADI_4g16023v3, partial [Brachypodium distachyon]
NWPPTAVQPIWQTVCLLGEGVFRTTCIDQLIAALPHGNLDSRGDYFLTPKSVPQEEKTMSMCMIHYSIWQPHLWTTMP